jgi:putative ABC transport system ATP-binding protein
LSVLRAFRHAGIGKQDDDIHQKRTCDVIALEGIRKTYKQGGNEIRALDGIDLVIGRGDNVAIMGPSGSGKSTLLNVLGALDKPDAGSYRFEDDDVALLDDDGASRLRNRRIGFVFQSFHLLPRLTVLENVLLPLRYSDALDAGAEVRARQLLGRVGLADRVDHRPGELSGGQMQRAAIARALVMQPPLLLADEPTGNLDSKSAADVLALLEELNGEGQTLVMVTHDPDIAARARRSVHLRDGRIAEVRS